MYLITLDGRVFAQTGYDDPAHFVSDAKVTSKTDGSGSFDFTIYSSHQYYSKIFKMKSTVRVYLNKIEIFNGRVLEIEDNILDGERRVYCEGSLSYFIDSVLPAIETTAKLYDYICDIVKQHNEQVNTDRQFIVGLLDNKHINDEIPIKRDNYASSSEVLSDIVNEYGGFFKVRSSGSQLFLDYFEEYANKARQPIEIGINVNSASVKVSSDDIFTILIPSGKDGLTIEDVNDGKNFLVDEEGVEKYGRITATVGFDDIEDATELLNKAKEYMDEAASGKPQVIDVEAVDLSSLGKYPPIFAGDRVRLRLNQNDSFSEYTCTSVEYDLLAPENTKYEFGTPESSMTSKMNSANIQFKKYIEDNTRRIGNAEKDIVVNAENFDLRAGKIEEVQVTLDGRVTETEDGLTRVTEENTRIMQRLTLAEIEINGDEGTIGLKTQYALLDGRVTSLDDSYETLAARVNTVGEVASQAKIDIDAQAGTIKEIASRTEVLETDYAGIEKRVGNAEIDIDAAKADILLKADQSVVNELQNTVSQAQIDIDGANAKITAETERVDNLTGEVTSAKLDIDAANKAITAEVTRATTEEGKLAGRIKVTEDSITEQAGQISNQGELIEGVELTLNGKEGEIGLIARMEGAETSIQQNKDAIALRAVKSDVDAQFQVQAGQISSKVSAGDIASVINQTPQSVLIQASKIDLKGYVTAEYLQAHYVEADEISSFVTGEIDLERVNADSGSIMSLYCDSLTVNSWPVDMGTHFHTFTANADGTVTIGGPSATAGSFNIADTLFYKNGVSAAVNNVGVTADTWENVYNTVTGQYNVRALLSNKKPITYNFDATDAYDAGHDAGYNSGKASVTVSGSWSGGKYTAAASNGVKAYTWIGSGTKTITYNQDNHTYSISVPIMYSNDGHALVGSTGQTVTASTGTEAYEAGLAAGGANVDIDRIRMGWSSQNPTFETLEYTLTNDDTWRQRSVSSPAWRAVEVADDGITAGTYQPSIAPKSLTVNVKLTNGKGGSKALDVTDVYNKGYADGKAAASGNVTVDSISDVTYNADNKNFTITIKLSNGEESEKIIDGLDAYNAGKKSVVVSSYEWSNPAKGWVKFKFTLSNDLVRAYSKEVPSGWM